MLFFLCAPEAFAITVSGTLYSDEGVTPITTGKTIRLRVGTTTPGFFPATSNGSGAYSFTVTTGLAIGLPLSLWVNGDANYSAFAFTKASSTTNNITNFDLYRNRIRIKHEGILSTTGTTTSNAELGLYDGDDNSSIQFTANSNNLVTREGQKVIVAYGTNYVPGGTITTNSSSTAASPSGDFQLEYSNSTSSMITLGGTLTIAGSYYASSSSIINVNGYGVLFTATTTGKQIQGDLTGVAAFGSTTFDGTNGAWTFGNAASSTSGFTITAGSVTAPSGVLTVAGNFTNNGTFTHNSGTVSIEEQVAQLIAGRDTKGDSTGTGLASIYSSYISGNYLYVGKSGDATACNGTAGNAIGCELLVFDISTPSNPTLVAGRDSTGDSTGVGVADIRSLTVAGNYLYAGKIGDATACVGTAGNALGCELLVFDITTPTNPSLVAGRDVKGDSTGIGSQYIYSLTISGNYLYAGKSANATACNGTAGNALGCELLVFDITTPTSPTLSAGRDVKGDSTGIGSQDIYSLTISGNYLYAGKSANATACNGTAGNALGCELLVFDITTPTSPTLSAGRDVKGDSTGTGFTHILSLAVSGNYLYVGKSGDATACNGTAGNAIGCELLVFDISTPSNPTLVAGRDSTGDSTGVGVADIRSLTVAGNYLYAGKIGDATACVGTAGNAIGCELLVFNISTPTNPTLVAGRDVKGDSTGTGNASINSFAISINYLYVGRSGNATACNGTAGNAIGCELILFINPSPTLSGTLTGTSAFNNINFISGTTTAGNNASTTNLTINSYASLAAPSLLSVIGNYTNSGVFTANGGTTYFGGSSAQTLAGTMIGSSAFSSVNFLGAGTKAFSNNASTTRNFTIESTSGAVTAPSGMLTIAGNYTNNGTFAHNGGTTYLTGAYVTGTMTGSSAFNHVVAGVLADYTTAYDTPESSVYSLTVDSANGVLYAGTGGNGIIYRCLLSTACDAAGDWTTSYDTPETYIYSLAIDSANGVLYAGTYPNGIIYRCLLSTACDAAGDWTTSYDTPETDLYSLTIDSTNGVLYAGTGNTNGIIYRCLLSTACDAAGDWTTSYDTPESYIRSLTIDIANGVLYAGTYPSGIIYRCLLSTACDAAGDWTTSYDTPEAHIYSLTVDSTNGVLYAGSGTGGIIYRCATSTLCDAAGDWTTSYDTSESSVYSLTVDSTNGVLYATTGSGGIIYSCATSTACDATGDWTISYDTPEITTNSLAIDNANGVLFAGTGSNGIIYRKAIGVYHTISANASTTDLTIISGNSVTAPPLLSILGNYTNDGTFTHNSSIVYLNGSAQQTATGTMTGTSAFYNLTILNNFGTNAQTNPSVIFGAISSTTGTFTAITASTSIRFPAYATTSIVNLTLTGTSAAAPIFFRSSTPGVYAGLSVSGTVSVSVIDVKDSGACSGYANISAVNSTNGGNNICWNFIVPPTLTLLHYRWRMDHESEVSAGYYAAEDTALSNRLYTGDRIRLRTTIQNTGGPSTNYNYRLEYASSSCTTWSTLGATAEWAPQLTQYALDYSSTTDAGGLSNPGGLTWYSGVFRSASSTTGANTLPTNYFTEHEFSIASGVLSRAGLTYCFRLTNVGSITNFTYAVQPQIMLRGDARPQSGGINIEVVGVGPAEGGGTPGAGGGGLEGGGGGPPVGGGGKGGGGGGLE